MFQTPQPRHRYLRIRERLRQTGKYSTEDPIEEAVTRLLLGDMGVPEEILRSYSTFLDKYKREVVESFLLAEASPKDLFSIFRIKEDVIEVYQHIFFDIGVFYDRLDMESYAQHYEEDEYGHVLKTSAIKHGLEYLKATFGRGNYDVSPVKAVRESISQAYVNSKVAADVPLDSPKAKEARKWTTTMVKNIEALSEAKESEGNATSDYRIKLKFLMDRDDEEEPAPEHTTPEEGVDSDQIVSRRAETPS